jgi:uncharacterized protein YcnI
VIVAGVAALAVLGLGTPAFAHTKVVIDNPQAGATNVTMTVVPEAEAPKVGIVSVHVVLPDGITPDQVSLVSGPSGWTLTPTQDGYTVAGKALPVHVDAKHAVRLAQLPATATVLVFKTLVTYSDGRVDRWIEPPTASNPNPDQPAPTVTLKPAAAVPTTAAPTTAGPGPTTDAPVTTTGAAAPASSGSGSGSGALPWIVGAVVLIAAAVGYAVVRRRRAGGT